MSAELLARLRGVLEAERIALRSGQIDKLDGFLAQKEELVELFSGRRLDPRDPEVAALRRLARANAAMCDAAGRGVRAAIDRFFERSRVAGHLDTYDEAGQRRSYAAASREAPRRA